MIQIEISDAMAYSVAVSMVAWAAAWVFVTIAKSAWYNDED